MGIQEPAMCFNITRDAREEFLVQVALEEIGIRKQREELVRIGSLLGIVSTAGSTYDTCNTYLVGNHNSFQVFGIVPNIPYRERKCEEVMFTDWRATYSIARCCRHLRCRTE